LSGRRDAVAAGIEILPVGKWVFWTVLLVLGSLELVSAAFDAAAWRIGVVVVGATVVTFAAHAAQRWFQPSSNRSGFSSTGARDSREAGLRVSPARREALVRLAGRLNEATNHASVVAAIMEETAALLGVQGVLVCVNDRVRDAVAMEGAHRVPERIRRAWPVLTREAAEEIFGGAQVVVADDVRTWSKTLPARAVYARLSVRGMALARMVRDGELIGIVAALSLDTRLALGEDKRMLLGGIADQGAIALDHATLYDEMQRLHASLRLAYDTTLEGWSRALDMRDRETEGHTRRVTELTIRLARSMNLRNEELTHVRRGAILHDIGKMGIPDSILLKPGPLTEDEWAVMRRHPVLAYELLSPIPYLRPAIDIPYCHHEKWDGTGYPRGLKGDQIPLAARIFAVADVWDALRSDRPYRAAWGAPETREYIRSLTGTHFDPSVVDIFDRADPA
jgi:HD-GYP domain-containing protein (c-di-GMP phosphodiesterase class II)